MTRKKRKNDRVPRVVLLDLNSLNETRREILALKEAAVSILETLSGLQAVQRALSDQVRILSWQHAGIQAAAAVMAGETERRSDAATRANRKRHKPILPDADTDTPPRKPVWLDAQDGDPTKPPFGPGTPDSALTPQDVLDSPF
jgi:hypothetical protein